MAYSLYFGMKRAQWNGLSGIYQIIVRFLRNHLSEHRNLTFPKSTHEVEFEAQHYLGHKNKKAAYKKMSEL